MSSARRQFASHKKRAEKAACIDVAKGLRVVFALSVFAALLAGVLDNWDSLFGPAPQRLVEVYRTHGCRCAFGWARALQAQGFVVRLREYDTLEYVRGSLQTPEHLHGCHVGKYLGYFVEGHVSPKALRRLSAERPVALGVATQPATRMSEQHSTAVVDENSSVLLVDGRGQSYSWF